MNKLIGVSLLVATFSGLTIFFVSCAETGSDLPIVEFNYNGHQITVPLFEKNSQIVTEKRRKFDEDTVGALMDISLALIKDIIIKKRNIIRTAPVIPKIISLAVSKQKEYRKLKGLDARPQIQDGYTKKMAGLIVAIMDSKNTTGEKLTDDEAYYRTSLLMEASRRLPLESPSGLYVDWREMRIDGVRIDVYSEPIIEWFNKSAGRRLCITGAKQIAKLLEGFGGSN